MTRCNLLSHSHKGLKALLFETGICLQQTEFWNVDEAAKTILALREVISLFGKHALVEDCFVLSAVKTYEPSVADAFSQDHAKGRVLAEDLSGALTAYEYSAVITDKVWMASKINEAFSFFLVFQVDLMTKEEQVLNPILWRYYRDGELQAIAKQMAARLPAAIRSRMNNWIMRGMNVGEIIGWLKTAEQDKGWLSYETLLSSAEIALPWQQFDMVIKGLDETIIAA